MDDYFKDKVATKTKDARKAEGITGTKTQTNTNVKEHVETKLKNSYGYAVHAKTADSKNVMMGF